MGFRAFVSLAHAILGLLRDRRLTGYELKHDWFDQSIGHFWRADQAQIYRTLDQMAAQGLLSGRLEIQADRPNKRSYQTTPVGRAQLDAWLTKDEPLPPVRDPFLVRIFHAHNLGPATLRRLLEDHRTRQEKRLAAYESIQLPTLTQANGDLKTLTARMTLERGITSTRAAIDWCNACLAALPDDDVLVE